MRTLGNLVFAIVAAALALTVIALAVDVAGGWGIGFLALTAVLWLIAHNAGK